MERPALKRLMDDVRTRRIDVIVVYKVDRLTRSLADFAKLVELFDEHQVGIVMSGWRPLIKGFFGVALVVGAVMSSTFRAENQIRWPWCCPLIRCPDQSSALDCADNATGFRINPLFLRITSWSPSTPMPPWLLVSVGGEPCRHVTPEFPDRPSCRAGLQMRCAPSCWQAPRRQA